MGKHNEMPRSFVNAGLAPINHGSSHLSKSEEQGHSSVPRSSHGKKESGQWAHGQPGPLHVGKLPQASLQQGQQPLALPSSGSQTARQIRSSGGPRGDPSRGSLSARPSSKGTWAAQKNSAFGDTNSGMEREIE